MTDQRGQAAQLIILVVALSLIGCTGHARVISTFGEWRDGGGTPRDHAHEGVDVWGQLDDPVLAAADGRVWDLRVLTGRGSCGKFVELRHDLTIDGEPATARTKYCHLSEYLVSADQEVKRGEVIGYIGRTGWMAQPIQPIGLEHVHWEVRLYGRLLDPVPYTVGCFDPKRIYPTHGLVLTWPVRC